MEIAYCGASREGKTIFQRSDRVHYTGVDGVSKCSWRDFGDAGFPADARQHNRHAHTLGSARTHVSARRDVVMVDIPRNTNGCYDDICDYYGLPEDHPLRFYHPLWIRAIQGYSNQNVRVYTQGF